MLTDKYGIEKFMIDYPDMYISPSREPGIIMQGIFAFTATPVDGIKMTDKYNLKITIPEIFPKEVPKVNELNNKIPRDGNHHINQHDDTLCLGSPLRLKMILYSNPTLVGFAENILVPFLYAMTHERFFPGNLPADELEHGEEGILHDYYELFKLESPKQVYAALRILGLKKRIANKEPCPCNCGKRYGNCNYNKRLEKFRLLATKGWFRNHADNLGGIITN